MTDLTGPVHIVGIGGAGMSGIARILVSRGVTVSGSDAKESKRLVALRALGVDARVGHDPENVRGRGGGRDLDGDPPDEPGGRRRRERGIPVVSRADALASVMAGSRGVAVAGTHGKTTTTSMLTIALQHCGADPSFAIGSELNDSGANAHQGAGDLFVVEADESDGSFLMLPAQAGIVTNVEPDHLDHWGTFEAIEAGFVEFAEGIGAAGGFVVLCADDPGSARTAGRRLGHAGVDVRTYGVDPGADYRAVRGHHLGIGLRSARHPGRWGPDRPTGPADARDPQRPQRHRGAAHRDRAGPADRRPARGALAVHRDPTALRLQG